MSIIHDITTWLELAFAALSVTFFPTLYKKINFYFEERQKSNNRYLVYLTTVLLSIPTIISAILALTGIKDFVWTLIAPSNVQCHDFAYFEVRSYDEETLQSYERQCRSIGGDFYDRAVKLLESKKKDREEKEAILSIRECVKHNICASEVCFKSPSNLPGEKEGELRVFAEYLHRANCAEQPPAICSHQSYKEALQYGIEGLSAFLDRCKDSNAIEANIAKNELRNMLLNQATECISNTCNYNKCVSKYSASQYAERSVLSSLYAKGKAKTENDLDVAIKGGALKISDHSS